jgi:hypothetical protein
MEPPPGHNTPVSDTSSIHARLSPVLPTTSDLALEAELKVRLEEIAQQRDDESAAMSDRLHALVKLYKERDQSFVDRYKECLEQVSRLPRDATIHSLVKPCREVVDQEIFYEAGVFIRFYPDTSLHLLHGAKSLSATPTIPPQTKSTRIPATLNKRRLESEHEDKPNPKKRKQGPRRRQPSC